MQRTYGLHFEKLVIEDLIHAHHCHVFTSDTLDRDHGVDMEIRGTPSGRLKKPVQVQITRRTNHPGKLKAYINTRESSTSIIHMYVDVHSNAPRPRQVAEHIVWASKLTQEMQPYGELPIFGLQIDDEATFFDPHARLRELDLERKSPERLAALRNGTVFRYDSQGFWIMDDSDQSVYRAHYIDVFDTKLRHNLRNSPYHFPVRFFPAAPLRAIDVRRPR